MMMRGSLLLVWTLLIFAMLICAVGCTPEPEVKPQLPDAAPSTSDGGENPQAGDAPDPVTASDNPPPADPQVTQPIELTLEQWVARLAAADELLREEAELALRSAGPDALEPLLAGMQSESADERRAVVYFLLEKYHSNDPRISVALISALTDDDDATRGLALQAVRRMPRTRLPEAAAGLSQMLQGSRDSAARRAEAAQLIGKLETVASQLLPVLTRAASEDGEAKVRAASIYAISRVATPEQALPLFQTALQDEDVSVRVVAAARLGRLGAVAAPAVEALAAQLDDPQEKARRSASEALARIGAASVPPLIKKLESGDAAARLLVLQTLAYMGPTAKPAIGAIEKRLTDDDPQVRQLAEALLLRLGGLP